MIEMDRRAIERATFLMEEIGDLQTDVAYMERINAIKITGLSYRRELGLDGDLRAAILTKLRSIIDGHEAELASLGIRYVHAP